MKNVEELREMQTKIENRLQSLSDPDLWDSLFDYKCELDAVENFSCAAPLKFVGSKEFERVCHEADEAEIVFEGKFAKVARILRFPDSPFYVANLSRFKRHS